MFQHALTMAPATPVSLQRVHVRARQVVGIIAVHLDRDGCSPVLGVHQWISDEKRYRWGKPATCHHWDPNL